MIQIYLLLLSGLLLLFISGKYLVDSSVVIAHRLKIPTMIIGLTVVAFGTSAPELLVSIQAAVKGYPEMAIGNVVGSNISNILLVLAITALIFPIPVPAKSVRHDWPVLMFVSLLLFAFSWDGTLSRTEGLIFIFLLVAYIAIAVFQTKRKPKSPLPDSGDQPNEESKPAGKQMKGWIAGLILLVSCVGLAFGADLLVENAAKIAEGFGISQRVISISMVAVGTSIPELATSVIAALKKETDISVGNIIGSNIMNILSVLGVTSVIGDISIDRAISHFDIPMMLAVTMVLLLMMVPAARSKVTRWEGIFMIMIYLLYIYMIF
ncbi:MAG: calcium/sodium antiporter [Bacteroidetes bacterium]|nr:calcium/sodium antiporter [Bacteroidota bacterium]